ncbi:MAG: hypothetical protein LBQ90_09170 [Synergistaceae bacterium]|nr:hypothetical protein [Synergistaceae bacterium]
MSPQKQRRGFFGRGLRDVVLFGRVLSLGLLVGGYVFAGVFIARWMAGRGLSPLMVALTPVVVTFFGLWQGWLFISRIGKGGRKN